MTQIPLVLGDFYHVNVLFFFILIDVYPLDIALCYNLCAHVGLLSYVFTTTTTIPLIVYKKSVVGLLSSHMFLRLQL